MDNWGETIITIMRFIKCYANPVIILLAALFAIAFSGNTEAIKAIESEEAVETLGIIYALSAIVYGFLSVWVFSIGALIVLVQLIYGLVKYFTVEENKDVYLHYFYGFAISLFSYVIIFSVSINS